MSTTTAITIRLDKVDYDRLLAEAERRGVPPESVAGDIVHESLHAESLPEATNERIERTLRALDELAELTANMPPIDVVQIVREGRDELEQRGMRWLSS